jgi:hypothetical protein
VLPVEISAEGTARGVEGGVVEWGFAGFAAHPIGTEELFRHEGGGLVQD